VAPIRKACLQRPSASTSASASRRQHSSCARDGSSTACTRPGLGRLHFDTDGNSLGAIRLPVAGGVPLIWSRAYDLAARALQGQYNHYDSKGADGALR